MALNLEADSSKRAHSQSFAETRYKNTHNNLPTVGQTDEQYAIIAMCAWQQRQQTESLRPE